MIQRRFLFSNRNLIRLSTKKWAKKEMSAQHRSFETSPINYTFNIIRHF